MQSDARVGACKLACLPEKNFILKIELVDLLCPTYIVQWKDLAEELVLVVVDRLDDEAVVSREVEERPRLAGRTQLRENVLGR